MRNVYVWHGVENACGVIFCGCTGIHSSSMKSQ